MGDDKARETAPSSHVHQTRCRREERTGHRHEPTGVAHLLVEWSWTEETELARVGQEAFEGRAGGGGAASIVGAWHRRSVSRLGR